MKRNFLKINKNINSTLKSSGCCLCIKKEQLNPNGNSCSLVRETGLSSCYRKVHRTFLLNFIANKAQNSEPRLQVLVFYIKNNQHPNGYWLFLVRETGLEPVRVAPHAPQTCASADSATLAQRYALYQSPMHLSTPFLKFFYCLTLTLYLYIITYIKANLYNNYYKEEIYD